MFSTRQENGDSGKLSTSILSEHSYKDVVKKAKEAEEKEVGLIAVGLPKPI